MVVHDPRECVITEEVIEARKAKDEQKLDKFSIKASEGCPLCTRALLLGMAKILPPEDE